MTNDQQKLTHTSRLLHILGNEVASQLREEAVTGERIRKTKVLADLADEYAETIRQRMALMPNNLDVGA